MLTVFAELMCRIGKLPGADVLTGFPLIGEAVQWDTCAIGTVGVSLMSFITAMACGQIGSAIMAFAAPIIMCNIELGARGARYQTECCPIVFSSLAESSSVIRLLSNHSADW